MTNQTGAATYGDHWVNSRVEEPWRHHLRGMGFEGEADENEMWAVFFGTLVTATTLSNGGFKIRMHRDDPRTMILPGGPRLPGDLEELQFREEIWNQVSGTVEKDRLPDLATVLRPSLATATRRALSSMRGGTYRRFTDIKALSAHGPGYCYGTAVSAERTAAEITAEHTRDPEVVAELALDHPDPEIRAIAIRNPACPAPTLLRCAQTESGGVTRRALLAESRRAQGLTAALTLSLLTRGPLDLDLALRLLLHEESVEDYQAALLGHVLSAGPTFRLRVAHNASDAAPHRRDHIHEALLKDARRIPYTLSLIRAILGEPGLDNHERVRWMRRNPNPRIQELFAYYLQHNTWQPPTTL